MKNPLQHWSERCAIVLVLTLTALQGCAWLVKKPQDDFQARIWVERLSARNEDLTQFKGLGRICLQAAGQSTSGRIAWAAHAPDRLRVEWLNMLGQPLSSLIADGQTILLVSYTDNTTRRFQQGRSALQEVIHLPIGIEDLQDIISGRPPLPPFSAAVQAPAQRADNPTVLLKSRWNNLLARLDLDSAQDRLNTLCRYDVDGALQYSVQWQEWQIFAGRLVPRTVVVSAASGERLTLTVERLWADPDLKPETFALDVFGQSP